MSSLQPERGERLGPNTILQLLAVVREREGEAAIVTLLERAGLSPDLATKIEGLVPAAEVRALYVTLVAILGPDRARSFVLEAGRRTALYLLAHRIPRRFQQLLALLPKPLRRALLLAAIGRHAWTFTGGGHFGIAPGAPFLLVIEPCPLCPERARDGLGCVYYAATFEELFRNLVDPQTRIEPAACGAAGSRRCELRIGRLSV